MASDSTMSPAQNSTPPPLPSRALRWVSSVEPAQLETLQFLQGRMAEFYNDHNKYYADISFGETAWTYDPAYERIRNHTSTSQQVLEVGCGKASILHYEPTLARRYTGLDFSAPMLTENERRYPGARFFPLGENGLFPVPDASYDLVFSVYVLEHTVFPAKFLDECLRALKAKGRLIIYCPNFLGRGWMTSQRVGFSASSVRKKISEGRWIDALISTYDRAVRIPFASLRARWRANSKPRFYVNIAPTCFTDPFIPDRDATYLTYAPEIAGHLNGRAVLQSESRIQNSDLQYYLVFTKA